MLRARYTGARPGKPAELSQFPIPILRNDSAPHSCKVQQAWAGPDNRDSCSTGSESPICTDAFFPSFFSFFFSFLKKKKKSLMKSRFVSKPVFPQEAGVCSEGVRFLPSPELRPPEDKDRQELKELHWTSIVTASELWDKA